MEKNEEDDLALALQMSLQLPTERDKVVSPEEAEVQLAISLSLAIEDEEREAEDQLLQALVLSAETVSGFNDKCQDISYGPDTNEREEEEQLRLAMAMSLSMQADFPQRKLMGTNIVKQLDAEHLQASCRKTNPCGHPCGGIAGEVSCLPCLQGCNKRFKLKQKADDICIICYTDSLYPIPSILLNCGHVFHLHCCRAILISSWNGPRISFNFSSCPICKVQMNHPALSDQLAPVHKLYEDVKKKALMRLEYEGLSKCNEISTKGSQWYNDPIGFVMDRYAYYVCFKCGKAYFGGEARCDMGAAGVDDFKPEELVCGSCSDVNQAGICPKHGAEYVEYKCRYCCSIAVFFCFGTTHFCSKCHDDHGRIAKIPKDQLPPCPVAPKVVAMINKRCPLHMNHPATGQEFVLGCGLCRNLNTF